MSFFFFNLGKGGNECFFFFGVHCKNSKFSISLVVCEI